MIAVLRRLRLPMALFFGVWFALAACSPVTLHAWWSESTVRAQGFAPGLLSLPAGGQLAYREAGQGPALLLLHGFGGNGLLHWRRTMSDLVKQYHVVTPDLLGFGDSSAGAGPLSLDAQVDALIALIQARQLREVRVVGISYGGFIALELARRLPATVSRVVIINSPGPIYQTEDLRALERRAGVESVAQLFVPATPLELRRLISMTRNQPAEVSDWLLDNMLSRYYRGREAAMRALMDDLLLGHEGYRARMANAALPPSVVIWSEADAVFPLPLGRLLAERLRAPMILVENAGHSLMADQPDLAVQALRLGLSMAADPNRQLRLGPTDAPAPN